MRPAVVRRRAAWLVVLAVLSGLAALAGCTDDPPPLRRLVIAGGPDGDSYLALGTGIADTARERWPIDASVLTTAGSKDNLQLIADGKADAGFATIDTARQAVNGETPFSGSLPIVAVAGLYDDYLHVATLADSPIRTFSDLSGHRLGTGGSGLAARILTDRLLYSAAVGSVTSVDLPAAKVPDALVSGRVDAIAITGGLPTPAFTRLARSTSIRLLPIATERAALFESFPDQYLSRSIPAGIYGNPDEVETVGVRTVLVVRADLPDRAAEAITELVFAARARLIAFHEEARRLDPRSALDVYPLSLHPGAAHFYRRTKPWA